jgi:hypothetical protein
VTELEKTERLGMMRSKTVFAGIFFLVNAACSDTGSNDNDSGGGAGQPTAGSAGSGGSNGGAGTGGAGGASSGGKGGSGSSAGGSAGKAGAGGSGGGLLEGTCGQRIPTDSSTPPAESTIVTDTAFDGFEDFYIIGDEGLGTEVCVVRFTLTRVGEAPADCVDLDAAPCEWTHRVAYSNPMVVLDEGGVCASSSPLALDEDAIAAIDGTEVSYGYIFEYQGHPSVVMKHDPALDSWISFGLAGYHEPTGVFSFTHPEGFCTYSAPP